MSRKHLYRFGYIKSKSNNDNSTSFISDEEDNKETSKIGLDPLVWMGDFNDKMLKVAIKV